MNWMTVLWPMMIGACVMLGLISLRIAFGDPHRVPYFFFALSAFSIAVISRILRDDIALGRRTDLHHDGFGNRVRLELFRDGSPLAGDPGPRIEWSRPNGQPA